MESFLNLPLPSEIVSKIFYYTFETIFTKNPKIKDEITEKIKLMKTFQYKINFAKKITRLKIKYRQREIVKRIHEKYSKNISN